MPTIQPHRSHRLNGHHMVVDTSCCIRSILYNGALLSTHDQRRNGVAPAGYQRKRSHRAEHGTATELKLDSGRRDHRRSSHRTMETQEPGGGSCASQRSSCFRRTSPGHENRAAWWGHLGPDVEVRRARRRQHRPDIVRRRTRVCEASSPACSKCRSIGFVVLASEWYVLR